MELSWEDIEKAHRNLRQIYLYLATTVSQASSDPGLAAQLQEISSLCQLIERHLETVARNNTIDAAGPPPDVPSTSASLDHHKLRSIESYLGKIARWLDGAAEAGVPERARGRFAEVLIIVGAMTRLFGTREHAAVQEEEQPNPLTAADFRPTGPESVEVPEVEPLVLEHTFQEPLLRGIEGKFELTQRAVRLLDDFLTEAGLSYDAGERRRFYRQVARWLEATPEGMVLTLRLGGLSGRLEPYPRYLPRNAG